MYKYFVIVNTSVMAFKWSWKIIFLLKDMTLVLALVSLLIITRQLYLHDNILHRTLDNSYYINVVKLSEVVYWGFATIPYNPEQKRYCTIIYMTSLFWNIKVKLGHLFK